MELSFAPMEGVTGSVYRRVHAALFPGADVYYAPFIAPDSGGSLKGSALRELLPENNRGLTLVPQILCNAPGPFLAAAETLAALGYREVNLNVGCPSGTVFSKHKGAGMLADLESLERCLDGIFAACPLPVSVKTRLGVSDAGEFADILALYRRYPLARLIVHARTRDGMYRSTPDQDAFSLALEDTPFPVIYNGNVFGGADFTGLCRRFPGLAGLMLGRGAACNPALFRQLRGGPALRGEELRVFHERLVEENLASGLSPLFTVQRMKELWFYLGSLFPGADRPVKNILRSRGLDSYRAAVSELLSAQEPDTQNPRTVFAGAVAERH